MKWLFILLLSSCLVPMAAHSQFTTDPQWERPQRHYFKLGGGYTFPENQSSGLIGGASVGWRAKHFLMAGIGAEIFELPGYNKFVIPAGLDINLFNYDQLYSPVLHLSVAKPFESLDEVTGKYYFSAGLGLSVISEARKGGILTVNYSRLNYDQVLIGGAAKNINQAMYSVMLHFIL